ncbi:hypothetical protein SASK001_07880 [Staphylococcus argenteus]|nr:hypothetical protein SA20092_08620 [Staphylococcus argenteus]
MRVTTFCLNNLVLDRIKINNEPMINSTHMYKTASLKYVCPNGKLSIIESLNKAIIAGMMTNLRKPKTSYTIFENLKFALLEKLKRSFPTP